MSGANIRLKTIVVENSPLVIKNGDVSITNTTISQNMISGALVINGGIGINSTIDAVSNTAGGCLSIGGGAGIMKSVYIGNNLTIDSSNGLLMANGISVPRLFLDSITNKNFYLAPDGVNKRFNLTDTNLTINITANSTNSSTGAVYIQGGLSLNSTANASNGSNGGALTIAGGGAFGKDLIVSNSIYTGQQYSNNTGIQVAYTGLDQLKLSNSAGNNYSTLNMNGNNLHIANNNDILIQSSIGNVVLNNLSTGNTMITVYPEHTEVSKYMYISDTIGSTNSSTGSLVSVGGISIRCTSDANSTTQGGSVTLAGGLSVLKKGFFGDTIGLDTLNTSKNNKLVLYQSSGDITQTSNFSGFGIVSSGSLLYQVNGSTKDHIFYSNSSGSPSEVFRIKGTNEVVFLGNSQMYSIIGGGSSTDSLSLQGQLTASSMSFDLFTADGDNNDNIGLKIFGLGLPNNVSNSEYLNIGYSQSDSKYIISINNSGSGVKRNLSLQSGISDQVILNTNGTTTISSTSDSINSSTGALYIIGGVSINKTSNSSSVTQGGALTIAGGMSISKDFLLGGKIDINAGLSSQITINTTEQSNYSILNISSAPNKNPGTLFIGNSSNIYPFRHSFMSLGSGYTGDYEALELSTNNTVGYTICSTKDGAGISRFIDIHSYANTSQLVLQTSGNIGVNTSTPNTRLDINGTLNCNDIVTFTTTQESSNSSTGGLIVNCGISIKSSTNAISITQGGSITTPGGISIEKDAYIGGVVSLLNTIPSESSTTGTFIIMGGIGIDCSQNAVDTYNGGALTVKGGAAIGGDLYVGGSLSGGAGSSGTFAYLTLTATDEALNLSTGSLVSFGGITIQCPTNATNISNGGALLVDGGGSFRQDLYIGGDNYIYGISNYLSDSNNVINLFDTLNIKRFSIDQDLSSHNFSISRYNAIGTFIEKTIEINNTTGIFVFNNTLVSSNSSSASVLFNGGVTFNCTSNVSTLSNGGCITVFGGMSLNKGLLVGGDTVLYSTTQSYDVSSGSLILNGGLGVSKNVNVLGNMLIVGDLTVQGQTTTLNSTNTTIEDNIIILNSGPSGSKDSGFLIQRYQTENDTNSGDVVQDKYPYTVTLPDQSGLSTTEIKFTINESNTTDYYKGYYIKITSGFCAGQVRLIIAYNSSTKIATVNTAWTDQNPAIGDSVYLYNKPYVGMIYNELNDRFEIGGTTQEENSIIFTDYIPLLCKNIELMSTENATSTTTGSFITPGGMTVNCTSDAISITQGNAVTILGGLGVAKTIYSNAINVNSINMTPNSQDIYNVSPFSANNNQTSFTAITGLSFTDSCWGFDVYLTSQLVTSPTTGNMYSNFHIRGVTKNGSCEIITNYVGDDTGIQFDITNDGQLRYTTPNYSNFVSLQFKWRAFVV